MTTAFRNIFHLFVQAIDCEFAFVGPPAFDVGLLLAHYILSYVAHRTDKKADAGFLESLLMAVEITWDVYSAIVSEDCSAEGMDGLMKETLGFLACEMLRRSVSVNG
eukprot:m.24263 g.24263  ORF g.24263 m.24263 type:complete len:107 (+) comp28586_c0_seq1:751-1071(+)